MWENFFCDKADKKKICPSKMRNSETVDSEEVRDNAMCQGEIARSRVEIRAILVEMISFLINTYHRIRVKPPKKAKGKRTANSDNPKKLIETSVNKKLPRALSRPKER